MNIFRKVADLVLPTERHTGGTKPQTQKKAVPTTEMAGATTTSFLILLDNSGSMTQTDFSPSRIRGAVNAVLDMVRSLARNAPECRVGVGTFAGSFHLCINPTPVGSGHREIAASLENLGQSGQTAMAHGLKGIRKMARRCPEDAPLVVLMLTDGHNTGETPVPVADDLKESGADFWAVGIGGSPSDVDESLLLRMVSGEDHYFFIGNWEGAGTIVQTFRKVVYMTIRD